VLRAPPKHLMLIHRAPSAINRSTSVSTSPSVLRSGWSRSFPYLGVVAACNQTVGTSPVGREVLTKGKPPAALSALIQWRA
jgi:hypothetical protein